jgi:hypothetical protein
MNNWRKRLTQGFADAEELEEFIESILHSHNEELIQRIEGMRKDETFKPGEDPMTVVGNWANPVYNEALTDIINLLKHDQQ